MAYRKQLKENLFHLALIGAFSLLVMAYSFCFGLTSGNDLLHHFQLADIVYDSISSHEFYPSLAPLANGGYGDVTIRFYPPFAYYILSGVFLIIGDWYYAGYITFFLIFWIGGVGVYLWAKEEFSATESLVAAAIYIFAPYHINQIYNNFLYAEFTASAILPFCFLFITRVCRRGKLSDVLGLSISYALLILTHLPATVIGSLIFGVYALAFLKKDSLFKTLSRLSVSVVSAFISSSFYWIRMVTEISWVNLSNKAYYTGTYDYRRNFLFTPQNILNFKTDELCLWLADLMLFSILLLSIPSIYFLVKERKSSSRLSTATAVVFLISVFMTTPLSKFIWDNLTFLQNVQFPWRWMGIVSVSGALFSTTGILRASELMNRNKNMFLTVGVGIIFVVFVFTSAFIIKQAVFLTHSQFSNTISHIANRDFDSFWRTRWAKSDALQVTEKLVTENRATEITKWDSTEKEFSVSGGQTPFVRVAAFYYPHWQATVNGENVQVEKSADGAILIPLPAEPAAVKLYFKEPSHVEFANLVSLTSWFIFAFIAGILLFKKIYILRKSAFTPTI